MNELIARSKPELAVEVAELLVQNGLHVVCDLAVRKPARVFVAAPVVRRGYDIYGNVLLKLAELFTELLVADSLAVV